MKPAHSLIQGPWQELEPQPEPEVKPDPLTDSHRALGYMGLILATIMLLVGIGYGMGQQHVNGSALDQYITASRSFAYGANALVLRAVDDDP